jgi:hypothetical protein
MQWVRHQEQGVGVRLFISSPAAGVSTKADQHMYINHRPVRGDRISKHLTLLHRQVKSFLDKGSQGSPRAKQAKAHLYPAFICFLEAPQLPHDVTFEPDKSQIEFADWGPLQACVHRAALKAWHASVPSALLQEWLGPQPAQAACVPRDRFLDLSRQCGDEEELQVFEPEDAFQLDELSSPQDPALAAWLSRLNSPDDPSQTRFGLQGVGQVAYDDRPPASQLGSGYPSSKAHGTGSSQAAGPSTDGSRPTRGHPDKASDWDAWQGLEVGGLARGPTCDTAVHNARDCQPAFNRARGRQAPLQQSAHGHAPPCPTELGRGRQQQFKGVQHISSPAANLGWRKPRGSMADIPAHGAAAQGRSSAACRTAWPSLLAQPQATHRGLQSVFGDLEEDLRCAVSGAGTRSAWECQGGRGQGHRARSGTWQGRWQHGLHGGRLVQEGEEPQLIPLEVQLTSRPVSLHGEPSEGALGAGDGAGNQAVGLFLSPSSRAALRQSPQDASMRRCLQANVPSITAWDDEDEDPCPMPFMRPFSPGGLGGRSPTRSDCMLAPSPVCSLYLHRAQSLDTPDSLHFVGCVPSASPYARVPGSQPLTDLGRLSPVDLTRSASPLSPIPCPVSLRTPETTFPWPRRPSTTALSFVPQLNLLDSQGSRPARSRAASTSPLEAIPLRRIDEAGSSDDDTPHRSLADQVLGASRQTLRPMAECAESPKAHTPGSSACAVTRCAVEEAPVPGPELAGRCSRMRKRASSAPPQARKRIKTAHTNPISSLRCSKPSPSMLHVRPRGDGGTTDHADGGRAALTLRGVHCELPRQDGHTAEQPLEQGERDRVAKAALRQTSLHDMGMRQRKRRQSDCTESLSARQDKRLQPQVWGLLNT